MLEEEKEEEDKNEKKIKNKKKYELNWIWRRRRGTKKVVGTLNFEKDTFI